MPSTLRERDHAALDQLPERECLSAPEKDALIAALWAEVQHLKARLAALETKAQEPRKAAHHSRVPPSQTPKPNRSPGPRVEVRREASVGRAGGGRPRHQEPDQLMIAQATTGPHWGGVGQAHEPHPHAVYDTLEVPPVTPIVTRVEQPAGPWPHCGQSYVAPVPVGMEPGTPFGASIQRLATYLRYPHAISYARLSALCTQVYRVSSSEGALAHLCQRVHPRLDDRVTEILTRRRSRRLLCSDETGARGNERTPWEWVVQHAEVCVPVMRPSRGHGVIRVILGDHRPTVWGSARYRAQRHHPAADWQGCLAHQRRDGQYAIEAGETRFAPRMTAILRRAFARPQRRETLAASTLEQYRNDLQRRVDRCLASQPTNPHGRRLHKRYAQLRDHWCLCLDDASIPPTNNSSEHAIRRSPVCRKVTHGLRSEWGRDLFAAVRSVINTGNRHGLSAYQAIPKALSPIGSLFEPG